MPVLEDTLALLNIHYRQFFEIEPAAKRTGHPVPTDTRAWSQIIVSTLVGTMGRERKKGSDLDDGSDVKAANLWKAIDTPRFNGVLPTLKKSDEERPPGNSSALDATPHLFFVLWDHVDETDIHRVRIWVVRANMDAVFRRMADIWYEQRRTGAIKSNNFQLHPPRNTDSNVFTNDAGTLVYPLLLDARCTDGIFVSHIYEPGVLETGTCAVAS